MKKILFAASVIFIAILVSCSSSSDELKKEEKELDEFRREMNRDAIKEGDCQFAFQVEDDGSSRYIGMGICEYWEEIYDSYLANDWPTSLSLSDVFDLSNMEAYLEATAINGGNFSWEEDFYLPEKSDCRRIELSEEMKMRLRK